MKYNNRHILKRNQAGLSVIEIIMVLGIMVLLIPTIYRLVSSQTEGVKETLISKNLKTIESILMNYALVNKESATSVQSITITSSQLVEYGWSDSNLSAFNSYFPTQEYIVKTIPHTDIAANCITADLTKANCPRSLAIYGIFKATPTKFKELQTSIKKISAKAGNDFGYIDNCPAGVCTVYSISGFWQKPLKTIFLGTSLAGTETDYKNSIIVKVDEAAMRDSNNWLNRLDSNNNNMNTSINLNYYNIKNIGILESDVITNDGTICKKPSPGSWDQASGSYDIIKDSAGNIIPMFSTSDCYTQIGIATSSTDRTPLTGSGTATIKNLLGKSMAFQDKASLNFDTTGSLTINNVLLLRGKLTLPNINANKTKVNIFSTRSAGNDYNISNNGIGTSANTIWGEKFNSDIVNVEQIINSVTNSSGANSWADKLSKTSLANLTVSELANSGSTIIECGGSCNFPLTLTIKTAEVDIDNGITFGTLSNVGIVFGNLFNTIILRTSEVVNPTTKGSKAVITKLGELKAGEVKTSKYTAGIVSELNTNLDNYNTLHNNLRKAICCRCQIDIIDKLDPKYAGLDFDQLFPAHGPMINADEYFYANGKVMTRYCGTIDGTNGRPGGSYCTSASMDYANDCI